MGLILIIIFLNLVAAAITLITSSESILKEDDNPTQKKIFKRNRSIKFTKKGLILLICFGLTIGLAIAQYSLSKRQDREREISIRQDQDRRDSIADKKSDIRNDHTIRIFTESLAKYGLKYDTA